jgi:hypothetical protein
MVVCSSIFQTFMLFGTLQDVHEIWKLKKINGNCLAYCPISTKHFAVRCAKLVQSHRLHEHSVEYSHNYVSHGTLNYVKLCAHIHGKCTRVYPKVSGLNR